MHRRTVLPAEYIKSCGHKVYPYLLRSLIVDRPNPVGKAGQGSKRPSRCNSQTRGWISRASRWPVASSTWRLWWIGSAGRFCMAAVDHHGGRFRRCGKRTHLPNTAGRRFTGAAFTGLVLGNKIAISIDGHGAWRDNVFVEWLWRSVKHEGPMPMSARRAPHLADIRVF